MHAKLIIKDRAELLGAVLEVVVVVVVLTEASCLLSEQPWAGQCSESSWC